LQPVLVTSKEIVMLDLALGRLAVFDRTDDEEIDYTKPQRFIQRTISTGASMRRLRIVAAPRYQIQPGAIDILVYKRAGGEEHFVYSEQRPGYMHGDQLRVDLFLQHAPWGAGNYVIHLRDGKMLVATGEIEIR
jgi:hypothetical protein